MKCIRSGAILAFASAWILAWTSGARAFPGQNPSRRARPAATRESSRENRAGAVDGAQLEATHTILARDAGLRGDGLTDNAAAFDAVRADMLAHGGQLNVLVLEHGATYLSSRNRWLTGVRHWKVIGNGATLREIGDTQERWLYTNPGTFEASPTETMTRKGDLIASASAGSRAVRLLDAAVAPKYVAQIGARVLLYGCNAYEGGYPPDPKYFEWRTIKAVDAATGMITLTTPLRFAYRQDWPENPAKSGYDATYATGRARIRLMRGDGFAETEYGEISDLSVTATSGSLGGVLLVNGARQVVLRNVTVDTFIPSVVEEVRAEKLRARFMEGDKIVRRLTVVGGTIGQVAECLGIQSVRFQRVAFTGKWLSRPHQLIVEDCDFYGSAVIGREAHQAFVSPRNGISMVFRRNRFHPPAGVALTWNSAVAGDALWPAIASGSFTVTAVDGPETIEGVGQDSVAIPMSVRPGLVFVVKGKDLRGRFRYVQASQRSTYPTVQVVVEKSGTDSFAVGDIVQIPTHESITFQDNEIIGSHAAGVRLGPLDQPAAWNANGVSRVSAHLDFFNPYTTYLIAGYLRELEVRVDRPYTGPDRNTTLRLQKLDSPGDPRLMSIDLSQAGARRIGLRTLEGARGNDMLVPLRTEQWNSLRWFTARNGATGALSGTPEQMPIVSLRLVRAPLP